MIPPGGERGETVVEVMTTADLLSRFAVLFARFLRDEVEQVAQMVARRTAAVATLLLLLALGLVLAVLSVLTLAVGVLLLLATLMPLWAAVLLSGLSFGLLALGVAWYATAAFHHPSGLNRPLGAARESTSWAEASNP